MQIKQLMPLLLAAVLAAPGAIFASGTYTSRPPRPMTKSEKMDSAKYDLGKRVYNGKATVTTAGTMAGQDVRLRALEARLSEKERKKANLNALAGKLTPEQLDALEYYVAQRFPQK